MGVITVLTDDKNEITKTILNKKLESKASGHIVSGTGQAHLLTLAQLKDLIINDLHSRQCISMGIVEREGLDEYKIVSKAKAAPGDITRSNKDFSMYDEDSFMLFDIDGHDIGPVIEKLIKIDPDLGKCGMLQIPSASSWLWDEDNGEWLAQGKSTHLYIEVSDGTDIKDYGHEIFRRLIMSGEGKVHVVKTSGAKLLRSLVDEAVWTSPNREIFEVSPICPDGIVSKRLEKVIFDDGPMLDIDKSLESIRLSPEEEILYRETVDDLKNDPDICKLSGMERKNGLKIRATRSSCTIGDLIKNHGDDGFALGASESIMDNQGRALPIQTILESPFQFKDQGIPDPIDFYKRGDRRQKIVGQDIARVRVDENTGRVYIFSFFGSIEYDLLWDFKSILIKLSGFNDQDDLEEWLDEMFDTEVGAPWMGYRLTATELAEVAKVVAKMNKNFLSSPNSTPSKYGTDGTSAKSALKSLHNVKLTNASKSDGVQNEIMDVPGFITKINKKHGIGMYGGKAKIIYEDFRTDLHLWEPRFIDIQQLKMFHAEDRVVIMESGRPKEVDVFSAWEVNASRNKFSHIVFEPSADKFRGCGAVPVLQQGGKYNLWMGYLANLDNAKRCKKILWHIRHVWCGGNTEWYLWTLKWFAELFQHPDRVGQPFIVLKSLPGAGKNIIIDGVVGRLLGIHAISTSNKKDIIGDFNHRLGINVFCFLNEAFFAGDKSDRSAMKTMIDEHRTITKKYMDSEHSRNMTKVVIASNEENVTGAEVGDRRYKYLPVSDRMKGNTKYFKELQMEIDNGGREAFLKFMLQHRSEIDLSKSPDSGESQQKIDDILFGSETPVKFLYDLLSNGITAEQQIMVGEKVSLDDARVLRQDWNHSEIVIQKESLLLLYLDYCDRYKVDGRFGRRDMQGLFKTFGRTGLQIYVSHKGSSMAREKAPMAGTRLKGKITLRLWKRDYFLEVLEGVFLSH